MNGRIGEMKSCLVEKGKSLKERERVIQEIKNLSSKSILLGTYVNHNGTYVNVELVNPLTKHNLLVIG